jgi:2-polyprenyl-3-methyl-5-hydroxy-6-metoxy-1,4-benzoquinol methylase
VTWGGCLATTPRDTDRGREWVNFRPVHLGQLSAGVDSDGVDTFDLVIDPLDELLAEQLRYYSDRAPEYDEAYERRGRHDHGPDANRRWHADLDQAAAALERLPIDGADILELAAGTGVWTAQLAARAASLTAVDASAEMIALNEARLGPLAERVRYEQANLFAWRPQRLFDAVVFCFWITHVPMERLDAFLATVADAVRPDGWVFFVDNQPGPLPLEVTVRQEGLNRVTVRRLNDGRDYRVVKNYLAASELERRCRGAGISATVTDSSYFQYAVGRRR